MFFTKGFQLKIIIIGCLLVLISGDDCQTNPCKNGSCKLQSDNQYTCQCIYGWKGTHCDENIDDCQKNPCKNGGQCIDQKNGRFICRCTSQFVGDNCQHNNPCLKENPCSNDGICEPTEDGKFQCKCHGNFIGKLCENKTTKCPDSKIESRELCTNNGLCEINQNGALFCKCDPIYTGKYCDRKILLEIGCKEDYCLTNEECIILENGSPKCVCKKGFTGKQCSKEGENSINSKTPKKLKGNTKISKLTNPPVICDSICHNLKRNGVCNMDCNTLLCEYDGGDCDPWRKCNGFGLEHCRKVFNNGICNPECNSVDCLFDGDDCQRSACQFHQKCSQVYQNQICNEECNNPQCGFDGGDCQTNRYNSFFSKEGLSSCSSQRKVFELDLILITSINNFTKYKSEFLQKLSSTLRMVVTVNNFTEINFNHSTALLIKLYVNHTQCILYGGQCFSSLEQISNFLKAGIEKGNVLSLPFRLAKVDTRVFNSPNPNGEPPIFTVIIGAMVFGSVITFILIGVLLRDKWGKLRSKIKTAGVWTPSDGYSTSTSSINSGHKLGWPKLPQLKDFKNDYHIQNKLIYNDNNRKIDQVRHFPDDNESERINVSNNRKRKYETINRNEKALAFQLISDCLENNDGIHPIDSGFADIYAMISAKNRMKFEEKFQTSSLEGLGEYVNENGESLLHIAARMNCGPNIIKQLNSISPSMLQSLDEWGRTPLASSIAADAAESAEQLIILEKQLRKESKNKSRLGINGINSGTTCEYLVKKTTALIEAVKLDSKELINILLDEGNPVNILDSYGRSVVHWAAMLNNYDLLERLSHMKIFQKLADLKDNEDKSPLYLAANDGALESVKFLLGYFNKLSIKIDLNCPCPKMIAEEKGFFEVRDIIQENLRKVSLLDKNEKKLKLKESKTRNKNINFEIPSNLCIIDEYKELSANSIENFPNTPMGNESIDSCLLELCSITDPSIQNTQELYSNEKNLYSSFKPTDYQYQGYQSNTSSSDMSPPLLNLNNQQFQNGFNPMTHSDPLDSNFSNTFFMSPKSFIGLSDTVNVSNKNKALDFPTEYYNYQTSPTLSEYKYSSAQLPNFPPVNCLL